MPIFFFLFFSAQNSSSVELRRWLSSFLLPYEKIEKLKFWIGFQLGRYYFQHFGSVYRLSSKYGFCRWLFFKNPKFLKKKPDCVTRSWDAMPIFFFLFFSAQNSSSVELRRWLSSFLLQGARKLQRSCTHKIRVWWVSSPSCDKIKVTRNSSISSVVIFALTEVFDGTVPSKIIFSFPCNPYFKPNFTCLLTLFLANNFGEKEKYSFWRNRSIKNFRQMVTNQPYFQIKDCGCRLTGPINPLNNCQRKCSLISLQKKRGHRSFSYSQSKMTGCTYMYM